jgi:gas vesicle protein
MSDSNEYSKGLILGTIIGGAIGAFTALLLAPKSGKEFRRDIADTSNQLYGRASEYVGTMEDQVGTAISTTVNEGKQRAQNIINSARRQAEDLLANAEDVLKDAKVKAGSAKDQIQGKIDHIRDAAKASAEAFKTEYNKTEEE